MREGYAQVATFPPNVKYVERFQEVQREANRGQWGLSEGQLCRQMDRGNGIEGGCEAGSETAEEPPSPSGPSDAGGGGADLDCSDFSTQEEAHKAFEQDPGDPNRLDGADQGEAACGCLP